MKSITRSNNKSINDPAPNPFENYRTENLYSYINDFIKEDISGKRDSQLNGEIVRHSIGQAVSDYINYYKPTQNNNYFICSNKWIGHVENIDDNKFTARVQDLNDASTFEMADFDFKEISPDDFELFKIGAAFYWNIGYSFENGQKEKKSSIRFQRVYKWTQNDYDRALSRADELFDKLNEE